MSDILSNYGLYIKERLNMDIIEDERGFITYQIKDDILWSSDVFIKKEHRQTGVAKEWFNLLVQIAKDNNCTHINGHVCIDSNGWSLSFKLMIEHGFKVVGQVNNMIYVNYTIG